MSSPRGFNIQDFKQNIQRYGVLQNNKFLVTIADTVSEQGSITKRQGSFLQFRAEDVKLPGASLEVSGVHRYGVGVQQKFPTNINFSDMVITFIEDDSANIYQYIVKWLNQTIDFGLGSFDTPSYNLSYKDEVTTDIVIAVFNNEGAIDTRSNIPSDQSQSSPVLEVTLKGAYPIAVNDIPLSWDSKNSLIKVSVTFAYTSFTIGDYISTN